MKRTKMEVEKELMDAYRTHSFVLQYDPDCAPGWRCKIDRLKQELREIESANMPGGAGGEC